MKKQADLVTLYKLINLYICRDDERLLLHVGRDITNYIIQEGKNSFWFVMGRNRIASIYSILRK